MGDIPINRCIYKIHCLCRYKDVTNRNKQYLSDVLVSSLFVCIQSQANIFVLKIFSIIVIIKEKWHVFFFYKIRSVDELSVIRMKSNE